MTVINWNKRFSYKHSFDRLNVGVSIGVLHHFSVTVVPSKMKRIKTYCHLIQNLKSYLSGTMRVFQPLRPWSVAYSSHGIVHSALPLNRNYTAFNHAQWQAVQLGWVLLCLHINVTLIHSSRPGYWFGLTLSSTHNIAWQMQNKLSSTELLHCQSERL